MEKIILASKSPRRKELFSLLSLDFEVITRDVPEDIDEKALPEDSVLELAYSKAEAVFREYKERIVLGLDTLVYTDTRVFGKPKDAEDAKEILRYLSGKSHMVVTGVVIMSRAITKTFYTKTKVTFYSLSKDEIDRYVTTGEPMDKAGAYAAQGYASRFIEKINGDFYTVVGMPLSKIYQEFKELKII